MFDSFLSENFAKNILQKRFNQKVLYLQIKGDNEKIRTSNLMPCKCEKILSPEFTPPVKYVD